MMKVKQLLSGICLLHLGFFIQSSQGQCQISGISNWNLPKQLEIIDTDRGEIFRAQATNIISIASAVHSGDGTINYGPYFLAELSDGDFVLTLSERFQDYEEFETSQSMNIAITFSCSGATASTLIFLISIVDTNNNSPQFVPEDGFTFTVVPPIIPGYELTGCSGEIVVRDIDLTNYDINFSIENNDYFEIINGSPGDVMKTYNARLVSKTLIRSLTEPLTLQITAEDVDLTNDPRRTATTTITIMPDASFEVPSELAFNAAYYITQYDKNHTFYNANNISLIEGFDEEVLFTLSGETAESFSIAQYGNNLKVALAEPLPASIIEEQKNIYLVIEAERQYTSGAVATLVIEIEQELQTNSISVKFSEPSYVGVIGENGISVEPIIIETGNYEDVIVRLTNDFEGLFGIEKINDTISIVLTNDLPIEIVEQLFVILVIEALYEEKLIGFAVVTLAIEKKNEIPLLFSSPYYHGTYSNENGLMLDDKIIITEGFVDDLTIYINGEHSEYFDLDQNASEFTLVLTMPLSLEILENKNIVILKVVAEKGQNISATTIVVLNIIQDHPGDPESDSDGSEGQEDSCGSGGGSGGSGGGSSGSGGGSGGSGGGSNGSGGPGSHGGQGGSGGSEGGSGGQGGSSGAGGSTGGSGGGSGGQGGSSGSGGTGGNGSSGSSGGGSGGSGGGSGGQGGSGVGSGGSGGQGGSNGSGGQGGSGSSGGQGGSSSAGGSSGSSGGGSGSSGGGSGGSGSSGGNGSSGSSGGGSGGSGGGSGGSGGG